MKKTNNNFTVLRPDISSSRAAMLFMLLLMPLLLSNWANAQANNNSAAARELHDKIAALDDLLFDAFNSCHLVKVETFFAADLEFYHEKNGLTTTRKSVVEVMKNNLCGAHSNRVRRELVKGSLEVYPVNNYGAVQTGEHRFYLTQKGQQEKPDGIGKFVHIWQKKDGEWMITRIMSYGFRPPE